MTFTPVAELPTVEGTPGLRLDEVAHTIVLGGGRDMTGLGLSEKSEQRLITGASVFTELSLLGNFVMCGYKTPTDKNGGAWTPESYDPHAGETFVGRPEAYGQLALLRAITPQLMSDHGRGVPESQRRIEPHSIDTVTNLTHAEADHLFGVDDERPTIVISDEKHLERVMERIAPKTLRRPYIGVATPKGEYTYTESGFANLASRAIALGVSTRISAEKAAHRSDRNARAVWGAVQLIWKVMGKSDTVYNTPNSEA